MELEVFERLEEKVETLIEECRELRVENQGLSEAIKLKDREIDALNQKLEKLSKEKGMVKDRVETLLQRLEGLLQAT